jgi:hypothetical protein
MTALRTGFHVEQTASVAAGAGVSPTRGMVAASVERT